MENIDLDNLDPSKWAKKEKPPLEESIQEPKEKKKVTKEKEIKDESPKKKKSRKKSERTIKLESLSKEILDGKDWELLSFIWLVFEERFSGLAKRRRKDRRAFNGIKQIIENLIEYRKVKEKIGNGKEIEN